MVVVGAKVKQRMVQTLLRIGIVGVEGRNRLGILFGNLTRL